jgi:hypothetical protein
MNPFFFAGSMASKTYATTGNCRRPGFPEAHAGSDVRHHSARILMLVTDFVNLSRSASYLALRANIHAVVA